jgi:hypothetical protein
MTVTVNASPLALAIACGILVLAYLVTRRRR